MFYPQSAHIIAMAGRGWIYCGSPTATSTWSSKKKVNGVGRPIATGDTGTRAVYVLGLPPCAHTPRFFLRYAIAAVGRRYAPLRGLCARAAALRAYAALFFCAPLSSPLAGDTLRCAVYVLVLPPCAHTPAPTIPQRNEDGILMMFKASLDLLPCLMCCFSGKSKCGIPWDS